jgi:hypothetical protein
MSLPPKQHPCIWFIFGSELLLGINVLIHLTWALNTMAEPTLCYWKRHSTVTAAALFTIQDIEHGEIVCAYLRLKYLVMTIIASQPLCMRPVGEAYNTHTTPQIQ